MKKLLITLNIFSLSQLQGSTNKIKNNSYNNDDSKNSNMIIEDEEIFDPIDEPPQCKINVKFIY